MDTNQKFYLSLDDDSNQILDHWPKTSESSQLITRHEQNSHTCDICKKSFSTKEHLTTHCEVQHTVQKTICTTFRSELALLEEVGTHLLAHSNQDLPGSSGTCTSNKTFTEHSELEKLQRPAIEAKSYACNSEIPSKKKLKVLNSSCNIEGKFECNICNKRFNQKCHLSRHELIHTAIKLYGCNLCDMRFSRKDKLRKHNVRHNSEKPCICSVCARGFSNDIDLNYHFKGHDSYKCHVCHFCGETFSNKSQWKAHQIEHLTNEAKVCRKCCIPYPEETIEQHLLTHAEDQKHTCVTCGRVFDTTTKLGSHFRSHTPFVCEVCKKTFSTEEHLLTHQVIHPN